MDGAQSSVNVRKKESDVGRIWVQKRATIGVCISDASMRAVKMSNVSKSTVHRLMISIRKGNKALLNRQKYDGQKNLPAVVLNKNLESTLTFSVLTWKVPMAPTNYPFWDVSIILQTVILTNMSPILLSCLSRHPPFEPLLYVLPKWGTSINIITYILHPVMINSVCPIELHNIILLFGGYQGLLCLWNHN